MHEQFDLVLLFMPGVLSHHGSSEELHRHVHIPTSSSDTGICSSQRACAVRVLPGEERRREQFSHGPLVFTRVWADYRNDNELPLDGNTKSGGRDRETGLTFCRVRDYACIASSPLGTRLRDEPLQVLHQPWLLLERPCCLFRPHGR